MKFHILGRTFTRVGETCIAESPDHASDRIIDLSQWCYSADPLDDAQILALTIGAILKGII